ncbi:MAG: hypothetical protein U0L79_07950 [Lachnospiraceae bacterium]|jgi:hypothetical protein|nr:hypothetical protein [Lachnospiraceae bacterium]
MYKKTWSIPKYSSTTYSDTNYHDELINTMEVAIPHDANGALSGLLRLNDILYFLS